MVHDIDVQWKQCPNCDYKAKTNNNLKMHKAAMHSIGVLWTDCPHCDHKSKQTNDLNKHIKSQHTSKRAACYVMTLGAEIRV